MTNYFKFPPIHTVYLIGAGRWARIYIKILDNFLPRETRVINFSKKHLAQMKEWVEEEGLGGRVYTTDSLPTCRSTNDEAAIIVNAAHDHEFYAKHFLSLSIPVLVEKPLASSLQGAKDLIRLSEDRAVSLSVALVFLYAEYLLEFSTLIKSYSNPINIEIVWTDASNEQRHNEVKSYDNKVSVIQDVMPHIVSIIHIMLPQQIIQFESLKMHRGGAEVCLKLSVNSIPCSVVLARNSTKRRREIAVTNKDERICLDFAKEPGLIAMNEKEGYVADPHWDERQTPLTLELESFLIGVAENKWDNRLSPQLALKATCLVEEISTAYLQLQITWLKLQHKNSINLMNDHSSVEYACLEMSNGKTDCVCEVIRLLL